tara:strand:+ start:419 stop:589 length:171 start_codon:yes stop_codon:yes gene_type:complete
MAQEIPIPLKRPLLRTMRIEIDVKEIKLALTKLKIIGLLFGCSCPSKDSSGSPQYP